MKVIYKAGVWDLLHIGHLNALRLSAQLGDFLVVGVATDEYVERYKDRETLMSFQERAEIISALYMVDVVVPYEGPEDLTPIELFDVSIRVVDQYFGKGGTSHAIRQRESIKKLEEYGVKTIVIPRTPGISSTSIRSKL